MKTNTITLRVSDQLKSQLEDLGNEQEKSISEITRSIIEDFFNSSDNLKRSESNYFDIDSLPPDDLLRTFEFTELIFWIYDKRVNPEINETNEFYVQHIDLIEKLTHHPFFGTESLKELNKVSNELKEYLAGKYNEEPGFSFSIKGNRYSFNYELFSIFFYGVGHDDDDNKILIYNN